MKRLFSLCLALLLLLCSCGSPPSTAPQMPAGEGAPPAAPDAPVPPVNFIRETADYLLEQLITPDLDEFGKVKAVYRYLIETVYFSDPVGLDMWRYLSDQQQLPSYVENRSLSPMLYGIGSCEDFAAAMVILCQQMGLESHYVAGYTISAEGDYVDHAWAVVLLDGNWYHVDPQLEQNVTKNGALTYRYFLKTDEEFATNHKWGENLIDYWPGITQPDIDYIRSHYLVPACTTPYPQPEAEAVTLPGRPDFIEVQRQIEQAQRDSGKLGTLPALVLDTDPPVLVGGQRQGSTSNPAAPYLQYGRSFLDREQQALYDELFLAATGWEISYETIPPDTLPDEAITQIITAFGQDNPQFYWCQPLLEYNEDDSRRTLRLALAPGLTLAQAQARAREIEAAADALLAAVSPEQALQLYQLHDYMAEHIYYEGDPAYTDGGNIYGGLVNRRALCDGYAKTLQYLMHRSGADCIYILGTGPGGASHAWNAVQLADGWYYVDVTWDVNKSARSEVFHDYCAVTLDEMGREHFRDVGQYPSLPAGSSSVMDYYNRSGYALTPDFSGDVPAQLATVLVDQLEHREIPASFAPVFLEVKVIGDTETYNQVKYEFVGEIFPLLSAMETEARSRDLPFQIRTGQLITCNFNDTMQILTLYPVVQAIM